MDDTRSKIIKLAKQINVSFRKASAILKEEEQWQAFENRRVIKRLPDDLIGLPYIEDINKDEAN